MPVVPSAKGKGNSLPLIEPSELLVERGSDTYSPAEPNDRHSSATFPAPPFAATDPWSTINYSYAYGRWRLL